MLTLLALIQAPPQQSPIPSLLMLAMFGGMAYLLMIRPMQKQRREQEAMRSGLKPGDEILTTGGLYGVIRRLGDHRIRVRIAENVEIELAKSAIAQVVPPQPKE